MRKHKIYHSLLVVLILTCISTVVYICRYTGKGKLTSHYFLSSENFIDELEASQEAIDIYMNKKNNDSLVERLYPNKSLPLLVIFTTFSLSAQKYVVRNNTLRNWKSFGSLVKPVFFSDDAELLHQIKDKGWETLQPSKTAIGIPVLKYMYLDAMKTFPAIYYAYANGDLLFTKSLVDTLLSIINSTKIIPKRPMLIVGQRTNVDNVTPEEAATHQSIDQLAKKGELFTTCGEDYFITNSYYPWEDCPEVVVGRIAYDNWLVLNANRHGHTTIDATNTLLAVHQTTLTGNLEGHTHTDKDFNGNLLAKIYRNINYGAGITSCTKKYTMSSSNYNGSTTVEIMRRRYKRGC